jgi:hypothetical protein
MPSEYRRVSSLQRERDLAQYALARNRLALVSQVNEIVGPPCYALAVMQAEFLSGQMEPQEMIDYARACREIIFLIKIPCLLIAE